MAKGVLILIQGPGRSIYFESFAFELRSRGYRVFIGSMCEPGPIQNYLKDNGFDCCEFNVSRKPLLKYYYSNAKFWKKYIKENEIEVMFSHLQWANFVAVLLNIFNSAQLKVIPTRHHIDASFLFHSKKRKIEDAAINLLAKTQVVVSEHAKKFMLKNEWFAREKKIRFVPLGYDFDLYKGLESLEYQNIRDQYPCKFLMITVARLITTKRHPLVIKALKQLIDKGLDVKLLILDNGPELENLKTLVSDLIIQDKVYFLGSKINVSDYIKAADILVQPSIEESSNQVLKEAGYYNKTAVVTKGIGDFDEYVIDKKKCFSN
jgi:glycosyltransferase involved in cell wall biosynthesis